MNSDVAVSVAPCAFTAAAKAIFQNGSYTDRIGMKVCSRLGENDMWENEAAISEIDYVLGLNVVPRAVSYDFDSTFPDEVAGEKGVASRWERDSIPLANSDSITKLSEALDYAEQAGKIAFLILAFGITDRHGENFVWNTNTRRVVMIDNECAFEFASGCESLWDKLHKFMGRCHWCRCGKCDGCIKDNERRIAAQHIKAAIVKSFERALETFDANKEAIKKICAKYSRSEIKSVANRSIFNCADRVKQLLMSDLKIFDSLD